VYNSRKHSHILEPLTASDHLQDRSTCRHNCLQTLKSFNGRHRPKDDNCLWNCCRMVNSYYYNYLW